MQALEKLSVSLTYFLRNERAVIIMSLMFTVHDVALPNSLAAVFKKQYDKKAWKHNQQAQVTSCKGLVKELQGKRPG